MRRSAVIGGRIYAYVQAIFVPDDNALVGETSLVSDRLEIRGLGAGRHSQYTQYKKREKLFTVHHR